MIPVKQKERDIIVQSLRAGVVPRVGLQHIQVGRVREVETLMRDLETLAEGGSSIRFIIGEYGAGKTFFLNLIRSIAHEKKLVSAHVDLTPDRRLHGTKGQARALYAQLMNNLSTRSRPEGGALQSVVERFITQVLGEAEQKGLNPQVVIKERLDILSEMVGGYDFAHVVAAYWKGHDSGNEQLKADAIRWMRAEFATRTDARAALGVRAIIDDASFYDHLKLMAKFVRLAGFGGLLVTLDEMVNLYKLSNTKARNSNYEQILRILNDCLQGSAEGLGILNGGTPEFLMDTKRGLYSYQDLQSRLAENTFAVNGLVDYTGPVLRLANLTPEDLYVLLTRIRHVFAVGDNKLYLVPDDGLRGFMNHCMNRIGEAYFRTPRNTVTAFVNLLSVLEQNPDASWEKLVGGIALEIAENPDLEPLQDEDAEGEQADLTSGKDNIPDEGLASFRL